METTHKKWGERVEAYLRRVWEQKGFCRDGQDLNVFIVDKGSSRGGEMKGLEKCVWGGRME